MEPVHGLLYVLLLREEEGCRGGERVERGTGMGRKGGDRKGKRGIKEG